MNWQPIATIFAPIIAFFIGFAVNRKLEKKPKLVSFISHSAAIPVRPLNGQPFQVHVHTVIVRNAGKACANNVRLSHAYLPQDFNIYPPTPHSIENLNAGGTDILFPKLIPAEQVSVTYLYYPPVVSAQINTGCKSDEGFANIVNVLWYPQQSKITRSVWYFLSGVGALAIIAALCLAIWDFWGISVAL